MPVAIPTKRPSAKRTRWPGVFARHRLSCPANRDGRCRCEPGYVARVWDPTVKRNIVSPTYRHPLDGVTWQRAKRESFKASAAGRPLVQAQAVLAGLTPQQLAGSPQELAAALMGFAAALQGTPAAQAPVVTGAAQAVPSERPPGVLVKNASDQFIKAMREGTALSRKGKPHKPQARKTIEGALQGRVARELGEEPLNGVTRGQVQTMIDEMVAEHLSGSRIRNIVNALRSLYNFAIPRDLAEVSPITNIVLPAVGEKPRDRIATPAEMVLLLAALELADAVPFALAAYATARSQEVRNLAWPEVDWAAGMLYLADEEDYAKSDAARRPFPLIAPLRAILEDEHARQGHPSAGLVCPGRKTGGRNSGLLSPSALYTRADDAWEPRKLEPIRLQDCRHTASSWMRAAGIDLKLRSILMGHASTASTDRGPGSITDDRYTHVLPGEIERAGQQLEAFLLAATTDHGD
jgi:integrase